MSIVGGVGVDGVLVGVCSLGMGRWLFLFIGWSRKYFLEILVIGGGFSFIGFYLGLSWGNIILMEIINLVFGE